MPVTATLDGTPWESWEGLDPAGTGSVRCKLVFSRGRTPTEAMSMGIAEIAPGGLLPLHHYAPAEIYHVLAGEGHCEVEGVRHHLCAGVSLFIPPGARHLTACTGKDALHFLFVFPSDRLEDVATTLKNSRVRPDCLRSEFGALAGVEPARFARLRCRNHRRPRLQSGW